MITTAELAEAIVELQRDRLVERADEGAEPRYKLTVLGARVLTLDKDVKRAFRQWHAMGKPDLCSHSVEAWSRTFICVLFAGHGGAHEAM